MAWHSHWLDRGFRPFFMGAGLWAVLAMMHWLHMLAGIGTQSSALEPMAWHRHEMIFGYGGAAMAGFLLTAIPNWTGRLPVRGLPLLGLFLLWVAGRLADLGSGEWAGATAALVAAVVDSGFWAVLVAVILRELVTGKNNRNLPVAGLVAFVGVASALDQAGYDFAWRQGLGGIVMLILLVGGRVTPSFTRNWLVKEGCDHLPAPFGPFDRVALGTALAALVAWIVLPEAEWTSLLLVAAGLAGLVRLGRWQGHRTFAEPLVTILHVGYGWIAMGLLLVGLDGWQGGLPISAVHALTAGGVAVMSLAVMTRASLGHSGRPLHAGMGLTVIYLLVNAGALLRVTAELWPLPYDEMILVSGVIWAAGFLFYVVMFTPMWILARRKKGGGRGGNEVEPAPSR
ncbi:MAG: NnrS family protein [Geminicoccaceae bacterium]|nr:NnrS family protein [Geminicoccaceae bacterium]MCB9945847.1 NnrS family protein [Geminicoccaceae bacterium]